MTSGDRDTTEEAKVCWPIARGRAMTRGLLYAATAFLLGAVTMLVYQPLASSVGGGSSRLVDLSIAVIASPLPLFCIAAAWTSVRWLLLAAWPAKLGVEATVDELVCRFGSFGTKRFDAGRIEARYPFELVDEDVDGGFEAFLPEEQQMAEFLPRMLHPDANEPINRLILKFSMGTEAEVAAAFGPMIRKWCSRQETDVA